MLTLNCPSIIIFNLSPSRLIYSPLELHRDPFYIKNEKGCLKFKEIIFWPQCLERRRNTSWIAKLLWPRSVLHQNIHQAHILSGMMHSHMSAESKLNKHELEVWATVHLCTGGFITYLLTLMVKNIDLKFYSEAFL